MGRQLRDQVRPGLEDDAALHEGGVRRGDVGDLVVDDAGRVIELGLLGKRQHQADAGAVEERHPRHLEQQLHAEPVAIEGDGAVEVVGVDGDLGDAVECDARARGAIPPDPLPLEYGKAFGLSVRFGTAASDAPVLRMLWRNENGAWRIRSYDLELP